jgi:hypothetical protein
VGRTGNTADMRNDYEVLFRKPEDRRQMVRRSCTYENNIKVGFKEMEYDVMEWIQMVQDSDIWQDHMEVVMSYRVNK